MKKNASMIVLGKCEVKRSFFIIHINFERERIDSVVFFSQIETKSISSSFVSVLLLFFEWIAIALHEAMIDCIGLFQWDSIDLSMHDDDKEIETKRA